MGAYLGEVLCKELNAMWVAVDAPDAEAFAVELSDRRVSPVAVLLKALSERQPVSLADYVEEQRQDFGPR
jgi:hypothetical protein